MNAPQSERIKLHAAGPNRSGGIVDEQSVQEGLSLMRTVYGVAMVFGLQKVLEATYRRFSPTDGLTAPTLRWYVVALSFGAILLLAVRFFWVPRSLSSYVHAPGRHTREVWRKVTLVHFPVTIFHAVVFFYVCKTFADMATQSGRNANLRTDQLTTQFVCLYAALLLLNAIWLLKITPTSPSVPRSHSWNTVGSTTWAAVCLALNECGLHLSVNNDAATRVRAIEPGYIWAWNNCAAAVVVLSLPLIFRLAGLLSPTAFVLIASAVFVGNSLLDLGLTADAYLLYHDKHRKQELSRQDSTMGNLLARGS